jgi:hypothetical protein
MRLAGSIARVVPSIFTVAFLAACGGSDPASFGGAGGGGAGGGPGAGGDDPGPPKCAPAAGAGGPYWIVESETVAFTVACATGLALEPGDLTAGALPAGATFDGQTGAFAFTPGLDQAAVYDLAFSVSSTNESIHVKIGVADKWDDPANVPVVDPLAYPEELGLPVLFLSPAPTTKEYTPAEVVYRGHAYAASAKLRGAASLYYPKNSYTIELPKDDKLDEPDEAGGFEDKRKIVLISTFDDNSYVRQRLAYDLWNKLDPGHLQIQTYSAVVYLNGQYFGLYTVSDHIDGFLMEDHGYRKDGNLYKAVDHDANFALTSIQNGGAPKQTLHQGYVKREGTPLEGEPGAFADLEALVSFVATSDSPTFLAQIDTWIDRRDYEDWWIFVTFAMADDSAGKNSYHYRDPVANGPFRYAPWDFNASFGQTWQTDREPASVLVDYVWANKLFERLLAEPTLGPPLRARYDAVLHDQYALEEVLGLVDGYVARIDRSARRDEAKWGSAYQSYGGWSWRSNFTTYEGEIAYLKAWLTERWQYQDALY